MKILLSIILVILVFSGLQYYTWRTLNRLDVNNQLSFWLVIFLILSYVVSIGFMIYLGPRSPNFIYLSSYFLLLLVPQIIILFSGLIGDIILGITSLLSSSNTNILQNK